MGHMGLAAPELECWWGPGWAPGWAARRMPRRVRWRAAGSEGETGLWWGRGLGPEHTQHRVQRGQTDRDHLLHAELWLPAAGLLL